jgi:hypothetical protein
VQIKPELCWRKIGVFDGDILREEILPALHRLKTERSRATHASTLLPA